VLWSVCSLGERTFQRKKLMIGTEIPPYSSRRRWVTCLLFLLLRMRHRVLPVRSWSQSPFFLWRCAVRNLFSPTFIIVLCSPTFIIVLCDVRCLQFDCLIQVPSCPKPLVVSRACHVSRESYSVKERRRLYHIRPQGTQGLYWGWNSPGPPRWPRSTRGSTLPIAPGDIRPYWWNPIETYGSKTLWYLM
jgi:hypothetical protein